MLREISFVDKGRFMVKREVFFWNFKYIVFVFVYFIVESCEFVQRDDEIVKYIVEVIVGGDYGIFFVMLYFRNSYWKVRQFF